MSLAFEQVVLEVFWAYARLVWEETVENWVLVCVKSRCSSVVEVSDLFVVSQHADSHFFESAPFIYGQELCQLCIDLESYLAVSVDLCWRVKLPPNCSWTCNTWLLLLNRGSSIQVVLWWLKLQLFLFQRQWVELTLGQLRTVWLRIKDTHGIDLRFLAYINRWLLLYRLLLTHNYWLIGSSVLPFLFFLASVHDDWSSRKLGLLSAHVSICTIEGKCSLWVIQLLNSLLFLQRWGDLTYIRDDLGDCLRLVRLLLGLMVYRNWCRLDFWSISRCILNDVYDYLLYWNFTLGFLSKSPWLSLCTVLLLCPTRLL